MIHMMLMRREIRLATRYSNPMTKEIEALEAAGFDAQLEVQQITFQHAGLFPESRIRSTLCIASVFYQGSPLGFRRKSVYVDFFIMYVFKWRISAGPTQISRYMYNIV